MQEKQRLQNIAMDYNNPLAAKEITKIEIDYAFKIFSRYLRENDSILEMGPAEGIMTEQLINITDKLEIVEGSNIFAEKLKNRFPSITVHCSLFEDFEPSQKFDAIIMGHVLEHVENPVTVLQKAKTWLKNDNGGGGVILAAVPNSHSLHRQAAVMMGLLDTEYSMSEADIFHGHRRIYSMDSYKKDFKQAGLHILEVGGYWLKPLSNQQIQNHWNLDIIQAFMKLGEQYPEIAADIYIIAKP